MAVTSVFPASFNLTDLNGKNGFILNGINAGDYSGWSVAPAGDINGDRINDVIIGAYGSSANGQNNGAGQSYVVFGQSGVWPVAMNLSSLNGSTGFVLNGVSPGDRSGFSVASAGDINNDGINDVIIGAIYASPNGQFNAGQSYVVFGRSGGWPAVMNLSSLNGSTGFALNGIKTKDYNGYSVASAGDINGDGVQDLIIGAYEASPNGQNWAGQSYVVFGRSGGWSATMNLSSLNGSTGFVLNGVRAGDLSGYSVASAGDINNDRINDVIIGACYADPNGQINAGQSYVVFGRSGGWLAAMNLSSLNGSTGFVLNGINADDSSGYSVASAGDINNDGINDVIIGAYHASPNGQVNAGQSYVVFGRSGVWPATMNLSSLNGSTGFALNGIKTKDYSGYSVASAGDVNNDGINDVIVGATYAGPNGQSYVIYGRSGVWPATMNQGNLNGSTGFVINGIKAGDGSGQSVSSAGDINGDGINDMIIGASGASPNRQSSAGQSYVMFGDRSISLVNNQLPVTQGQSVILNNTYLSANSGNFTSSLIQYAVSNVQYGRFELTSNPGIAISNFTQAQVNAGSVRFVQDGSVNTPSYSIVAQTGIGFAIPPAPQAANIIFSPFVLSHYPASLNLTKCNGNNGFVINGIAAGDFSGFTVSSAGDINSDGLADVLIGAYGADPSGRVNAGQSYVIFGKKTFWDPIFELSALNGSNGFMVNGIINNDFSGYAVSEIGDVNSDGIMDFAIGAENASPNNKTSAGQSYVLFGKKAGWNAAIELSALNGSNGFILNGISANDWLGYAVSAAGDLNGDGIMDLAIAADNASPNGITNAGQSYIIFGKNTGWNATLELSALNGTDGFIINGINAADKSGDWVSPAGDINGDGIDDILIGGYHAAPNGAVRAGQSYVLFGKRNLWNATLTLSTLNGTNGFALNGVASDRSGTTLDVADINGDGLKDLLIGAYSASPNGQISAGVSYVVFGQHAPWNATFELSTLNGNNGFVINGVNAYDSMGNIASLGDFNDDGISDILIGGSFYSASNGIYDQSSRSRNYVVFGKTTVWAPIFNLSSLDGDNGFVLDGFTLSNSGHAVAAAGDMNGDGLADILIGVPAGNPHGKTNAGQSYIIFGDRTIPLIFNRLNVVQGQSVVLNSTYLSVNSGNFTSSLVQYSVSNVQCGQFELTSNSGVAINNFTQAQLNAGLVRFVQDGSINTPSYSVVAQTGIGFAIPLVAQPANISFSLIPLTSATSTPFPMGSTPSLTPTIPTQNSNTSASSSNLGIIAGAAAAGAGAFVLLGGILWHRRRAAKKSTQETHQDHTSSASSSNFIVETKFNTDGMKVNPLLESQLWDSNIYGDQEGQGQYASYAEADNMLGNNYATPVPFSDPNNLFYDKGHADERAYAEQVLLKNPAHESNTDAKGHALYEYEGALPKTDTSGYYDVAPEKPGTQDPTYAEGAYGAGQYAVLPDMNNYDEATDHASAASPLYDTGNDPGLTYDTASYEASTSVYDNNPRGVASSASSFWNRSSQKQPPASQSQQQEEDAHYYDSQTMLNNLYAPATAFKAS